MLAKSLIASLHFIAAFGIAATLFFEWFTWRTPRGSGLASIFCASDSMLGVVKVAGPVPGSERSARCRSTSL